MAENRGFGSSQDDANYWPPIDESSQPRYQAPGIFNGFGGSSSAWSNPPIIPAYILKQAEDRVTAQKRFFKHLFIYLGVVTTVWLLGAGLFVHSYDTDRFMAVFLPLFITLLGGIRVAYSYFNAFIWSQKSHRERVIQEAQKLML